MKNVMFLIVVMVLGSCASQDKKIPTGSAFNQRTPSQVTGDFGKTMISGDAVIKHRIYVRFNTVTEDIKQNGKVVQSSVSQWSPCFAFGFVDTIYNTQQKSGGSCTGFKLKENSEEQLRDSRLGFNVEVNYDQHSGFSTELFVGINDVKHSIVKRVEDTIDMSGKFYGKFEGDLLLSAEPFGKYIRKITLKSVEIANSHYYEAGAKMGEIEQVNFSKIAEDFVAERGGLEQALKDLQKSKRAEQYNFVLLESKKLNKDIKVLNSMKNGLDEAMYKKLSDAYLDYQAELDRSWDQLIQDNPKLESKRVKFIEIKKD